MSYSNTVTRFAYLSAAALLMIFSVTATAIAQETGSPQRRLEVRVSSGALVPTGDQREQLRNARLTAAQVSWVVNPRLALTGTFSWARSRDLATTDSPKLDVFTSNVGAELRSAEWFAEKLVSFKAFAGVGAGARSYNYRKIDAPATNNLAGYGAIGGEVGIGRVALRMEARNYATGFKPLLGVGESATRNDVVIMAALRFNRHRSAQK